MKNLYAKFHFNLAKFHFNMCNLCKENEQKLLVDGLTDRQRDKRTAAKQYDLPSFKAGGGGIITFENHDRVNVIEFQH